MLSVACYQKKKRLKSRIAQIIRGDDDGKRKGDKEVGRTDSPAFSTAEISNRCIAPESFQHDADLLFRSELAAGNALDIPDKLLGFFRPGFSLPVHIGYPLSHGLLLSLPDTLLSPESRSKPKVSIKLCLQCVPLLLTIHRQVAAPGWDAIARLKGLGLSATGVSSFAPAISWCASVALRSSPGWVNFKR